MAGPVFYKIGDEKLRIQKHDPEAENNDKKFKNQRAESYQSFDNIETKMAGAWETKWRRQSPEWKKRNFRVLILSKWRRKVEKGNGRIFVSENDGKRASGLFQTVACNREAKRELHSNWSNKISRKSVLKGWRKKMAKEGKGDRGVDEVFVKIIKEARGWEKKKM